MVPSTILERQQALGLDPVDLNILLQLARHWWQADNPPHPSIKTIALCIKKSVSTVQRRIKRLEKGGLIEIEHRSNKAGARISSNYTFKGLIDAATGLAKEAIWDREETKRKASERRSRKAPLKTATDLKVVR